MCTFSLCYLGLLLFSYFFHIMRSVGSDREDAYKAIYQDIPSDWRTRPGGPRRKSLLATTHRDLRKLDIGLDNVLELAADRVLWRGLIRGATHHSGGPCY